jgi:ubiquinone/menaquinone biosynthesis C-methylase UbiE
LTGESNGPMTNTMPDEMQAPWNRSAEAYADGFEGQVTQAIEPTLDAAGVTAGSRVLDVATGPGLLAAAAAARGARTCGVDFAENMITVARLRHPNIPFEVCDATALPFDDASFDAVVIGFALFMMVEPRKALDEAHRVLVPGGRLACTVWDWPVPGFDLFYTRMEKYAPEVEMLAGDPPLLRVADHDVLRKALADAAFGDVTVQSLPIVWELTTPDRLFDALASLRDLSHLSESELASFRADVVAGAAEFRSGDRYRVPFPALLLSGVKP